MKVINRSEVQQISEGLKRIPTRPEQKGICELFRQKVLRIPTFDPRGEIVQALGGRDRSGMNGRSLGIRQWDAEPKAGGASAIAHGFPNIGPDDIADWKGPFDPAPDKSFDTIIISSARGGNQHHRSVRFLKKLAVEQVRRNTGVHRKLVFRDDDGEQGLPYVRCEWGQQTRAVGEGPFVH